MSIMQIFIKAITGRTISIDVAPTDTIYTVKQRFADNHNLYFDFHISASQVELVSYKTRWNKLLNYLTLQNYYIDRPSDEFIHQLEETVSLGYFRPVHIYNQFKRVKIDKKQLASLLQLTLNDLNVSFITVISDIIYDYSKCIGGNRNLSTNWSDLHTAVSHNDIDNVVKLLEEGNCYVDQWDHTYTTPLEIAVFKGYIACAEFLIINGARRGIKRMIKWLTKTTNENKDYIYFRHSYTNMKIEVSVLRELLGILTPYADEAPIIEREKCSGCMRSHTKNESVNINAVKKEGKKKPQIIIPKDKKACDKCTYFNYFNAKQCEICNTPFSNGIKNNISNKHSNNNKYIKKKRNRSKIWQCINCNVRNDKITNQCSCGSRKPLDKNQWKCAYCTCINHINCNKCSTCKHQRMYDQKGDWQCKEIGCYEINRVSDMKCRKCHKSKLHKTRNKQKRNKWNKMKSSHVVIRHENNNNNYKMSNGHRYDTNQNVKKYCNNSWSKHVGKYSSSTNNKYSNNTYSNNSCIQRQQYNSHSQQHRQQRFEPQPQQQMYINGMNRENKYEQNGNYNYGKHSHLYENNNYRNHIQNEFAQCNKDNSNQTYPPHFSNNNNNVRVTYREDDIVFFKGERCKIVMIRNDRKCTVKLCDRNEYHMTETKYLSFIKT